jgi:carbon monoxide dehydrogenase subunit G
MATFSSHNRSTAEVPASRQEIWAVLRDPEALAELTPLVERITVDGDRWTWKLHGVSALGVQVCPSFTERMIFTEGERIEFHHDPPAGAEERAGAEGTYVLADAAAGRTHLDIDITVEVELPLPRLSAKAVERVMATTMARTGDRFARNLYRRLGIDPHWTPSDDDPRSG